MARSARVSRAKRISDENLGAQPREVAFGRRSEPSSWRGHGQSGSDPRPRVLGDEPAAQLMGRAIVTPPEQAVGPGRGPSRRGSGFGHAGGSLSGGTPESNATSVPSEEPHLAQLSSALGEHRDKTAAAWDSVLKLLADTTAAHASAAMAIEGLRSELEAVNNRLHQLSSGMALSPQMRVLPATG